MTNTPVIALIFVAKLTEKTLFILHNINLVAINFNKLQQSYLYNLSICFENLENCQL